MSAEQPAASFDESPEERDQRRRERADKARPNVSMTPGQAETLAEASSAAISHYERRHFWSLRKTVPVFDRLPQGSKGSRGWRLTERLIREIEDEDAGA